MVERGVIPNIDELHVHEQNDHMNENTRIMHNNNELHAHMNEDAEVIDETMEPVTTADNTQVKVHRTTRVRSQPKHLQDYVVKLPPSIDHADSSPNQASSTVQPFSHYLSNDKFSANHRAFLSAIDAHDEPKSFQQAVQHEQWREAMMKEIKALEQHGTWTLEELAAGKKAIDFKWVYKVKYKSNGEVERYKARLVAKGFTQLEGVDYHDTFAPVAKLAIMRTLLTLVVKRDWIMHQLDVNNTFLHGDLDEEVYMKLPQHFRDKAEHRVCRLRKSIYGLKQASRNWYYKFTKVLLEMGYKQSVADPSLFICNRGRFKWLLLYM